MKNSKRGEAKSHFRCLSNISKLSLFAITEIWLHAVKDGW